MPGSYDPLRDVALLLAAAMQTAGTQARTVTDPLMRLAGRLGFTYRTDPAEIEDKLRAAITAELTGTQPGEDENHD